MSAALSELNLYPVKGLRGIALRSAEVADRGLKSEGVRDREFVLVDETNVCITQRERPHMARYETRITNGVLYVTADHHGTAAITPDEIGARTTIVIHGNKVPGHSTGAAHDRFFSQAFGENVRLIRQTDDDLRLCPLPYAVKPGVDNVGFADDFPYLVTSRATLEALNSKLVTPVPMARFRTNLEISGLKPDEEYALSEIAIGNARFSLQKPCTRCKVTTVDQARGEVMDNKLLTVLAKTNFIRLEQVSGKVEQGAVFGMNAIATQTGTVQIGMPVVTAERPEPWAFRVQQAKATPIAG